MTKPVLCTFSWPAMPFWSDRVDSEPITGSRRPSGMSRIRFAMMQIIDGWRLWRRSRGYAAVITDSPPSIAVFGLLQRLPYTRARRHLMLDCYWNAPRSEMDRILKRILFRLMVTSHTRIVHYARDERRAFSSCFGIPESRFVFIPYHHTLYGQPTSSIAPRDHRYIFAGGDSLRDYETLFAAVEGLCPVVIALLDRSRIAHLSVPTNVEVVTLDGTEFMNHVRHAYVNVVPLAAGTLRSAGHQTFLNAMAFGTAVVVTDHRAEDYIDPDVTGLIVPAGDPIALRLALTRLLDDEPRAREMGRRAAIAGETLGTARILPLWLDFVLGDGFADATVTEFLPSPAAPAAARRSWSGGTLAPSAASRSSERGR